MPSETELELLASGFSPEEAAEFATPMKETFLPHIAKHIHEALRFTATMENETESNLDDLARLAMFLREAERIVKHLQFES